MHTTLNKTPQVISSQELLDHWQGHRALTRRAIEAFPEEAFFSHTIGGMRTFAEMVMELLGIAAPGIREIATGISAPLNEHLEHGNKRTDYWNFGIRLPQKSIPIGRKSRKSNFNKTSKSLVSMMVR